MEGPRSYPAKVLLYGEHTVLRGGRGLAVPYPATSLHWEVGEPDRRLLEFGEYLLRCPELPLDGERLLADLRAGQRLEGDIPNGYGLGSSGAVCAAVWDRYGTSVGLPLAELRRLLARLEAHFHGSSSGTDPLISYLQGPVLLEPGGKAATVDLPANWAEGYFLLDTGIERSASPLIERFLASYDRDAARIQTDWQLPADAAIDALISGNRDQLYRHTAALSEFQLVAFPDFIPEAYHADWNGGDAYRLKLCGAGGGGMLLGLARNRKTAERRLGKLSWLKL